MAIRGTPPETPGREGFSLSALSLLLNAGKRQVSLVYLKGRSVAVLDGRGEKQL
jgi:hypothetical protein